MGTVGYMSPEQVRGEPADHRSDIFSFGVVLYEMLSGRKAFGGESGVETLNAILHDDPAALVVTKGQMPPALERLVLHCLEKSPESRFQSMKDVAFDLQAISTISSVDGGKPRARPRGRPVEVDRPRRRGRVRRRRRYVADRRCSLGTPSAARPSCRSRSVRAGSERPDLLPGART